MSSKKNTREGEGGREEGRERGGEGGGEGGRKSSTKTKTWSMTVLASITKREQSISPTLTPLNLKWVKESWDITRQIAP